MAKHVLVIDDHPLIREIIPAVVRKAYGEADVVAESDLEGVFARAGAAAELDLIVLDLGLPGCSGIDALERVRRALPDVPVIVLSAKDDRESIVAALKAGAVGYIPKTSTPDMMVAAFRLVSAGGTYVPAEALQRSRKRLPKRPPASRAELTDRQMEVLRLLLKGYSNQRIAAEMAITENTVKQHAHAIYAALGVSSRAEAFAAMTRRGLYSD